MSSDNKSISLLKDSLNTALLATVVIGMLTHAFSFLNIIFSHDSIYIYNPDSYKLALGRWASFLFKPLLNNLELPWISGCISLIAIAFSVFLFVLLFEIREKKIIWIVAGVFVTNISFTLLNATYCHDSFTYMLGVLSTFVSVYLADKGRLSFTKSKIILLDKSFVTYTVLSVVFLALGIGFYQAYFPLFSGCVILLCIKLIVYSEKKIDIFKILLFAGYAFFIMLFAGIFYKVCLNICLYEFNVTLVNEYNGIKNVFDFSDLSIFKLLLRSMVMPLKPILSKHFVFYRIMFYMIILCILALNIYIFIKKHNICLMLLVEFIFPLGLNFVYILSKGLMHDLMIYHYMLFPLLSLILIETLSCNQFKNKTIKLFNSNCIANLFILFIRNILVVCFIGLIGVQAVFANTVYLKKSLEYNNTYAICNRILDKLENIEQYHYDNTKVFFIGSLDKSKVGLPINGFENFYEYTGLSSATAVTYIGTLGAFIRNNLNYRMNLYEFDGENSIPRELDSIKYEIYGMRTFPEKDSVKYFESADVIVVKLSE